MNIIEVIQEWLKAKAWTKAKAQPLNGQSAYSISCVGKNRTMDELQAVLNEEVLTDIKRLAQCGHSHHLVVYENWVCADHKVALEKYLTDLQYKILYKDEDVLLISWKVK